MLLDLPANPESVCAKLEARKVLSLPAAAGFEVAKKIENRFGVQTILRHYYFRIEGAFHT